jgi:FtsP/CotA-like multicopper oxidase with cupredoxin domain
MALEPFDRRELFAGAGGLFVCTLAGQRLLRDRPAEVEKLAAEIPVPPKVRAAAGAPATAALASTRAGAGLREHWIRAEPVRWNIVPNGRDAMMDERVRARTKFTAYAYRAYTPGFEAPLGPATIPGPLLEVETGETLIVNFQNRLPAPVTMHPHGIFYADEMDGAYKGRHTDPGGFVQRNQTFRYVWEAHEGTEGAWLYHDHGPIDPLPVFKGLFGPLIIRKPGEARPAQEYFLVLHSFTPLATGLDRPYSCINGRAFAGNTPTLRATVGDEVAWHVFALDNDFHTFHVHGHRWQDATGQVLDNQTLGPGDSLSLRFVEDNPGRWFYHCHVFSHLHEGLNGWYLVD